MNTSVSHNQRVLSGMRPTGLLHLGHYHGVLKNWIELQHSYECFFFVADWHALTTHYENPSIIAQSSIDMVVDWLAAGVNPGSSTIFIQSRVPEHAELYTLLSMITPLGWLERVPSYKDQQDKLKDRDLSTFGFLGYPLLQSADILIYKAGHVPVGEDQVAHVELTREVARRFNHLYGKEIDFEDKAQVAIKKLGKKNAKIYNDLKKRYQEQGDGGALSVGYALLSSQQNISLGDKERLIGYLEGGGRIILPEPQSLLTASSKMPGLDGQKMSKSYNNTIALRESPIQIEKKVKTMPTDPARIRRTDAGNPQKCPVWQLHQVYSGEDLKNAIIDGCTTAAIGCVDCKQHIIDAILTELKPIQRRAKDYQDDRSTVESILNAGCEAARDVARDTMEEVRKAMGITLR
ncbi:MAG: tryptophan--tRNA ligase [Gammaproteobacteria bacterium]|nr:tryptophan--tRNA ligase [Gammaproteobacteria bacterium]MBL7000493.1 tryptophan--tRNA ligase [Gammaproteobacteria bacterium]